MKMPQPIGCSASAGVRALCVTIALATYSSCVLTVQSQSQPQQQQQQQQQHLQAVDDSPAPLRSLLALEQTSRRLAQDEQQQAFKQHEKHRYELKRRLHKLIDELVDTKLNEQQQQQTYPMKQTKSPELKRSSEKTKRKWSKEQDLANNLLTDEQQQQQSDEIVIIVKPPATSVSSSSLFDQMMPIKAGLGGGSEATFGPQSVANQLNLANLSGQQEQPARRPKVPDSGDHARRIMDDSFGIRRESLFSANNHLGSKGVPKFGSEEEY